MGGGRPRDPEVDAQILDAAREVMRAEGLDALSIAEVARRAGVGRPTVYRRYPDRLELALAVLYHDLDAEAQRVLAEVDLDLPLLDQLCAIIEPFFGYYTAQPGMVQVLMQMTVSGPSPWQQRLQQQVWAFLHQVAQRARRSVSRGELAGDVDVDVIAQAFFALYFSVVIGGFQGMFPDVPSQLAALRAGMAQHLRGLDVPR